MKQWSEALDKTLPVWIEIALNDLPKHIEGIDTIEYLIINDGSWDETLIYVNYCCKIFEPVEGK